MRFFRISHIMALSLSIACTSCGNDFLVEVADGGVGNPPELRFAHEYLWSSRPFAPCIRFLEVYWMTPARPQTIWSIRAARPPCVHIRSLRLGIVPPGFVQVGRYRPPEAGQLYRVGAQDGDGTNGSSYDVRS